MRTHATMCIARCDALALDANLLPLRATRVHRASAAQRRVSSRARACQQHAAPCALAESKARYEKGRGRRTRRSLSTTSIIARPRRRTGRRAARRGARRGAEVVMMGTFTFRREIPPRRSWSGLRRWRWRRGRSCCARCCAAAPGRRRALRRRRQDFGARRRLGLRAPPTASRRPPAGAAAAPPRPVHRHVAGTCDADSDAPLAGSHNARLHRGSLAARDTPALPASAAAGGWRGAHDGLVARARGFAAEAGGGDERGSSSSSSSSESGDSSSSSSSSGSDGEDASADDDGAEDALPQATLDDPLSCA
jgi:hypothetical protein